MGTSGKQIDIQRDCYILQRTIYLSATIINVLPILILFAIIQINLYTNTISYVSEVQNRFNSNSKSIVLK